MTKTLMTCALVAALACVPGCGGSNGPPGSMQDMNSPPPPTTISIKYDSPLLVTESLRVNGMFLPVGPWTSDLCPTVIGADVLSCDLRVPAGATSVVLSIEAKGGGQVTYSCVEQPCGSRNYQELGTLTVSAMGMPLMAKLLGNDQGCGCNHVFALK